MRNRLSRLINLFCLPVLLFALAGYPRPAQAGGDTCQWDPPASPLDWLWSDGDDWDCGHAPTSEDDVIINAPLFHDAPMVTGSAEAKTLHLTGYLKIGGGGVALTVANGWSNTGEAMIDSQGTIMGDGTVTPGGTFHFLSSGTITGNLTIQPSAHASVSAVYMHGNVVNNGILSGESDSEGQFHMLGASFINNGTVSVDEFLFERGNGAVQEISGSGVFDSGTNTLFLQENTRLVAKSNVSFGPDRFLIANDGTDQYESSRLDVGPYIVTFVAPVEVSDSGAIIGAPGGSVHFRDEYPFMTASISVPGDSIFDPPLVTEDGTTLAFGTFNGPISVGVESTLRVMGAPAGSLTAKNDVTVNGILDGQDEDVGFFMEGQHLTVNGAIDVAEVYMQGTTRQDITGSGSMTTHQFTLDTPGGVHLGVPLNIDQFLGLNANLYASENAPVTLEAATLGAGLDADIFGTIIRKGPFVKDETYSFGNLSLSVTFTDVGSALPEDVTITVKPEPWNGLRGSINRSFSIRNTGGSGWKANLMLDYRDEECAGLDEYLQVWSRSSAGEHWERTAITFLHDSQNWIKIDGLTHFSDWGLVLHTLFIPVVRR